MTFHEKGFRSIGVMGQPATDSAAGETRQIHTFVTNDDKAAVETANYFDALLDPRRIKKGDLILVSGDVDGTEWFRIYVLDIVASHVVLSGLSAAVTLTGAALTDNSGGAAATTIAAIGGTYNQAEVANAVASLAAAINKNTADIAALKAAL